MAENKTKDVAKLLGVELEEEFEIEGYHGKFKLIENGLLHQSYDEGPWSSSGGILNLLTGEHKIVKLSKSILTEKEREYLSAVIKPFRDRVINITKESEYCIECIKITLNPLEVMTVGDIVYLPNFIKWSMYEGMEPDKAYTIDELGL